MVYNKKAEGRTMSWNKHKRKINGKPADSVDENTENAEELETGEYDDIEVLPHWIHDTVEDESYVTGYKVLPSCVCSECGYHSNSEKTVCPKCGERMY